MIKKGALRSSKIKREMIERKIELAMAIGGVLVLEEEEAGVMEEEEEESTSISNINRANSKEVVNSAVLSEAPTTRHSRDIKSLSAT